MDNVFLATSPNPDFSVVFPNSNILWFCNFSEPSALSEDTELQKAAQIVIESVPSLECLPTSTRRYKDCWLVCSSESCLGRKKERAGNLKIAPGYPDTHSSTSTTLSLLPPRGQG